MNKSYHNTKENIERVFICEECTQVFSDEEIRKDNPTEKIGHICKCKKYKKEHRCESFLVPYLPEH